ncbi:MAG: DNA glycosylase [Bacteroidota bacterium]
MVRVAKSDLSLRDTLNIGQTFCWNFDSKCQVWQGWIDGVLCTAEEGKRFISFDGPSERQIEHYFSLDLNWSEIHKSFPKDRILHQSIKQFPGLKIVREPWWECTCNFICSSLKQVGHIQQINNKLRVGFGSKVKKDRFSFPSSEVIAQVQEKDLRDCQLGYRAKHLHTAANQIARQEFSFESEIPHVGIHEAENRIQKLRGVGNKVANCILLYSGEYLDAFPIDVWMERVLLEHYFTKSKKMPNRVKTLDFMRKYFGPYCGIAQLYLFHWVRTISKNA